MGDIGTHAFNLAEYVAGEEIVEVCAQLNTVVDGRALDDDGAGTFPHCFRRNRRINGDADRSR
jgi:predicted dehydrogenase